jgi:hypothetical protein
LDQNLGLSGAVPAKRGLWQKIQPLFVDLCPALGAGAKITGINPLQRCRNLAQFQLTREAQIL